MRIVITEGSFEIVPLPGKTDGEVIGFGLEIADGTSGNVVVAMMGHPEAERLGAALTASCEGTAAAPRIVLADAGLANRFKKGAA